MKKIVLIFIYTIQSSKKVRVIIFLFVPGNFSFISNATNFFINSLNKFVLEKNAYALLVFFNRVAYMQLLHMIRGINISAEK